MTTIKIEHANKVRYFLYNSTIEDKDEGTFESLATFDQWCDKARKAMENDQSKFYVTFIRPNSDYVRRRSIHLVSADPSIEHKRKSLFH